MRNNALHISPPAIFEQIEVAKQSQSLVMQQKKDFPDQESYIYHLTHFVNNKRHKNGRICMEYDLEKGVLYANSVSPYSKDFIENIEDGVKDLVLAFKAKRYLTYSSCEGHGHSFRRYVGLAFADEASRDYVANFIDNLNLPCVKTVKLSSVINQHLHIDDYGGVQYIEKTKKDQLSENEVLTFNIQFHRKYERYFFLEIIITDAITKESLLKKPFNSLYQLIIKKYFIEKITKKITQKVKEKDFLRYSF